MQQLKVSEGTAARRRIPIDLVDDTDGKTPETGITFSAGDIKVSKNGAAEGNHAGTVTELAGGLYYYEATSGELDTIGFLTIRFVKTGVRTFKAAVQIVSYDPYDAVDLGLTNLDATVSSRSTITTAQVNTEVDTALADVNLDHLVGSSAGIPAIPAGTYLDQIMDDGTAVYDRTTDSLQAVRDHAATIKTDTGDLTTRIGTPSNLGSGATVAANLVDIENETDDIGVAGAGLTNVPWNSAWDLQVESEVDDALKALKLDKLILANGTLAGVHSTTQFDVSGLPAVGDVNDFYRHVVIVFTSGPCLGVARKITSDQYLGATGTHTFFVNTTNYLLPAIPTDGDTFVLVACSDEVMRGTNAAALASAYTATRAGYLDELAPANVPADIDTLKTRVPDTISLANIAASVWDRLTSALTTVNSIGKLLVDNINATISSRSSHSAADVWTSGTRTLTSFGTLVSDIATAVWAAGTRTLTSFGTLIADIWANVSRTITGTVTVGTNNDKTGYHLHADGADDVIKKDRVGITGVGRRSIWNGLRKLVNKVTRSTSSGTLTVYAEDDTTIAYTENTTTNASAEPMTESDPN